MDISPLCPCTSSVRLTSTKNNRDEPDMNDNTTQPQASRDSGAVVGGVGVAPHEQPQLFSTPQITRTSDDYWTPSWLFDAIGLQFDLDVACPPGGSPWVPAKHYYTQAEDGLTSPWFGRVWMNPPYSKVSPWAAKFIKHGNGVALTVISKSNWFDSIWAHPDIAIVTMPQRFHFQQGRIPWPICLWAVGQDNIEAISKIGRLR